MLTGVVGAIAVPVIWAIGFLIVQRLRRGTQGFAERAIFKGRLAPWVSQLESYVFMALYLGLSLAAFSGVMAAHRAVRHTDAATPFAMVLIVVGCFVGALAPAFLLANSFSWLVPNLRQANEAAMQGLPTTSFRRSNQGLLGFAAVVVPVCVAQCVLGTFEPWVR
jgi:hypothetical protein